jgi:hypothetical protein
MYPSRKAATCRRTPRLKAVTRFVDRSAAARANGAFEKSPPFQVRIPVFRMKSVPAGRLRIFSRPGGASPVGHFRPAVETAGYFSFIPAGYFHAPNEAAAKSWTCF